MAPSLAEFWDLEVLAEEHAAREGCHGAHGLGFGQQPPLAWRHITPAQSADTSAPLCPYTTYQKLPLASCRFTNHGPPLTSESLVRRDVHSLHASL